MKKLKLAAVAYSVYLIAGLIIGNAAVGNAKETLVKPELKQAIEKRNKLLEEI